MLLRRVDRPRSQPHINARRHRRAKGSWVELRSRLGGRGGSQLFEALPCLRGLVRFRVALDQMAQFLDAIVGLPQLNQSVTLLELGGRRLVPAGEVLQNLVVVADGLLVAARPELEFGKIEV